MADHYEAFALAAGDALTRQVIPNAETMRAVRAFNRNRHDMYSMSRVNDAAPVTD
jgi:hypothetical protein